MEQEKYENFKRFIVMDHKIKKEMVDLRPPLETDALSKDAILKYTDDAFDSLRYIIRSLKQIIEPYDTLGIFSRKIDELSTKWVTNFIACKLDLDKLRRFYQDFVTDMSEDLVTITKKSFCAYSWQSDLTAPLAKCHTINEILHVMHFHVMNNENNLQSLNVIAEKKVNHEYEKLTLYGEENDLSKAIYDNFPQDLDVGITDIVSFGNSGKVIMMIRDLGHALTVEIDNSEDDILINYFIPKLCNIDMINKLPGINKVKEGTNTFDGATGRFVTTKENLCMDLFNFLSKVPTDYDIPREEINISHSH